MSVTSVIGKQIINVDNDTNYYFVVAPQGDSQSRYVEVTLTTNGGTPYSIPTGATIILEGKNAGGYNVFNSCSREDADRIVIPLTNGVLSYAGVGKYCVGIYSGTTSILSFPFNIVVTEAPYDIVRLEASDVYEALNQVIAKAADSNSWMVGTTDPHVDPICPPDTHVNDYYLNGLNGELFFAQLNPSTGNLEWYPMENQLIPGTQLNIMSKTYVRYATDATGSNFSDDPTAGGIVRKYIGFLSTVNVWNPSDPTQDINIPSNYTWASMSSGISGTQSRYLFKDIYTPTPPSPSEPWSTGWPTNITPGGYLWIETTVTFTDGTSATYYTVAKNGRSVDHMEKLKDEGEISHGEKTFRFIYDETGYYATTPLGTENPHNLGWFEFNGTDYVLTIDTSVQIGKTYYTQGSQSESISVFNGTDAGFADDAVTASVQPTSGKSSVAVTESGGVHDKAFDLAFSLRGSEFKTGTEITGSGQQSSTTFNDSNTIVGDLYINSYTGESYVCSAVTPSNSTWDEGYTFGPVTYIDDLRNTRRYYENLTPINVASGSSITITGSDAMFSAYDAYDNPLVNYHVKYLTSIPGIAPTKPEPVVITNGAISSTLYFKNTKIQDLIVTPDGTENPNTKGWYEASGNTYVLTSDTTVNPSKTYYQAVSICMEVIKKSV